MNQMKQRCRSNGVRVPILMIWTLVLVAAGTGVAGALEIRVTPSVLDVVSGTAEVNGRSLIGGSAGDRFTLGYNVENPDATEIRELFTSIIFDPSALRFVDGVSFTIFEKTVPGTPFDSVFSLAPIIDPRARPTSPSDTLFGLNHISRQLGDELFIRTTDVIGPELAIVVTFEILNPDLLTSIGMAFLAGDAATVNGVTYYGVGSSTPGSRDAFSDAIFSFKNFKVGPGGDPKGSTPVPEPTMAVLVGLGLAGLAGFSPRRRVQA